MHVPTRVLLAGALAALLAAGGLVAAVGAQEKGEGGAVVAPPAKGEDHAALVRQLGDPDFAVREKAYEGLRQAGDAARAALKEGAKSKDAQIRWSARRLLRLLDREPGERPQLVLRFGEDGDEDEAGADRSGPWRLFDDESFRRSMDDLRRRMEELERELRDLPGPREWTGFRVEPGEGGPKVERHVTVDRDGERTEVHQSADGKVKVTLSRKAEDGTVKEEAFEATSLEALKKEHPEIHAKVRDLLGDRVRVRIGEIPPLRILPEIRIPDVRLPELGWRFYRGEEAKPVLGATVSEVPPVLRTQLSMKADEGLVVEEVLPDTLASRVGLQRHDVLLAVNGIPVSTVEDVRSAVGAVKEGGAFRLRVLRGGKPADLEGTR